VRLLNVFLLLGAVVLAGWAPLAGAGPSLSHSAPTSAPTPSDLEPASSIRSHPAGSLRSHIGIPSAASRDCLAFRPSEQMPTRAVDRVPTMECDAAEAATFASPTSGTAGWIPGVDEPPGFETYNVAITYDSADGYLLLFGATGGIGPLNGTETWTYSGGQWTELHPGNSPQSCPSSALAYDSVDGYVVYFGGAGSGGGNCSSSGQTWTFSGGTWTQLHPLTSPSPRAAASFTNDSADGYLLLFGGLLASNSSPSSQTWTFVGGVWTELSPTTSPPARSSGGMTDDLSAGYVLLYGGTGAQGMLADTWSFSAGNWTDLNPATSPGSSWPDGLAYDTADGYPVYTSAANLSQSEPEAVWMFVSGDWSEWIPGSGNTGVVPPERLAEATAYDWHDGYFVLFGGSMYTWAPLHDFWSFSDGNWTNRTPAAPSPRELASESYDAADGYLLLFGGTSDSGPLSDTWEWSDGRWTQLDTNQSPPARSEAGMAYDAADGYVLMFGGSDSVGSLLNDTWEFTDGGWTQITPALSPPPTYAYETMTYDAADGYVLLVDEGNQSTLTTSWAYHAGTWTNLTALDGGPTPEPANGLVYDANESRVVLFGTLRVADETAHGSNETWTFLNGTWTNISSTVGPSPSTRDLAAMAYDAGVGEVVLFGGVSFVVGDFLNDTWSFSNDRWTEQFASESPSGRDASSFAFEPTAGTDVLFGGSGPSGTSTAGDCSPQYVCGGTWAWAPNGSPTPFVEQFVATPNPVELGRTTVLTAEVGGGIGPYSYAYTGLPTGCTSINASQLSCRPARAGNFSVTVSVVDSAGNQTSETAVLQVSPPLSIVSFNATPNSLPVGSRTLLSVTTANGVSPVGYSYIGLPPGCTSQTVPTLPCSPGANGTFNITVVATDSAGINASASLELTVTPAGSSAGLRILSFGATPEAFALGNSTTLYLNVSGGTGTPTLTYEGLPSGCASADQTPLGCTPIESGVFPVVFSANDSSGASVSVETNLTVYPVGGGGAAFITAFGASPGTVVVGSPTVVVVETSGGTLPLSFAYPRLPPGCLSANTARLTCTPTELGTFPISVVVTDARGNTTEAGASLTVIAETTTRSPNLSGPSWGLTTPYLEWIVGGLLGLLGAAGLTERALARRRVRQEGEALVRALNEEATSHSPPPERR
jgi:hypothetical protein